MKFIIHAICWMGFLLFLASCETRVKDAADNAQESVAIEPFDTLTAMEHLQERGVLRAVTHRQHLNYRLIEGRPAGFQFELLDDFCEETDLRLNLLVNDSVEDCYRMLSEGLVDLYAGEVDSLDLTDTTFHHILLKTPVALETSMAWVIPNNPQDSSLYEVICDWRDNFQRTSMKNSFYRYFPGGRISSATTSLDDKSISAFDKLIKAEAKRIHWDWRLLASIIYQESRFRPDLESDQGAYGLMRLMPIVMENYGVDYDSPPEDQLEAAGKLLLHIEQELPESITDSLERQKFVLACYNAGLGNVLESRERAAKNGKNPDLWEDNVEHYTPRQTYHFVRDVIKRYSHYKALIEP